MAESPSTSLRMTPALADALGAVRRDGESIAAAITRCVVAVARIEAHVRERVAALPPQGTYLRADGPIAVDVRSRRDELERIAGMLK